jgi:hypothetical protein
LRERRVATLPLRIVFIERHEHADAPRAVALPRVRPAAMPLQRRPSSVMNSRLSFDHLVGAQSNRWGYGKTERLGCLEVHDHLEFVGN